MLQSTGNTDITGYKSDYPHATSGWDTKTVSPTGQTALLVGMNGNTEIQIYKNHIDSFGWQKYKMFSGMISNLRSAPKEIGVLSDFLPQSSEEQSDKIYVCVGSTVIDVDTKQLKKILSSAKKVWPINLPHSI